MLYTATENTIGPRTELPAILHRVPRHSLRVHLLQQCSAALPERLFLDFVILQQCGCMSPPACQQVMGAVRTRVTEVCADEHACRWRAAGCWMCSATFRQMWREAAPATCQPSSALKRSSSWCAPVAASCDFVRQSACQVAAPAIRQYLLNPQPSRGCPGTLPQQKPDAQAPPKESLLSLGLQDPRVLACHYAG